MMPREIPIACPQRTVSAELAEDLPAAFLAALDRPVPDLAPESLPLPAEQREHLAQCRACRWAFNRALEERLVLRRELLCPPVERLASAVRRSTDPAVAAHVSACRFCKAQTEGLRRDLMPVWQPIPLVRASAEQVAALAERARAAVVSLQAAAQAVDLGEVASLLADLVAGGAQAQLVPVRAGLGARGRRPTRSAAAMGILRWQEAAAPGPGPNEVAVELMHSPAGRSLRVSAAAGSDVIRIGPLHGAESGKPIEEFRVDIRGENFMWRAATENGVVELPVAELKRAMAAGGGAIVISAWEPAAESH